MDNMQKFAEFRKVAVDASARTRAVIFMLVIVCTTAAIVGQNASDLYWTAQKARIVEAASKLLDPLTAQQMAALPDKDHTVENARKFIKEQKKAHFNPTDAELAQSMTALQVSLAKRLNEPPPALKLPGIPGEVEVNNLSSIIGATLVALMFVLTFVWQQERSAIRQAVNEACRAGDSEHCLGLLASELPSAKWLPGRRACASEKEKEMALEPNPLLVVIFFLPVLIQAFLFYIHDARLASLSGLDALARDGNVLASLKLTHVSLVVLAALALYNTYVALRPYRPPDDATKLPPRSGEPKVPEKAQPLGN